MKKHLIDRKKVFVPYCKSLKKEYADRGMQDLFDEYSAWEDFNNVCDEEALDNAEFDEDGAIYVEYTINDLR